MIGDISERMLHALVVQLIAAGKIDADDVYAAADYLEKHGDDEGSRTLSAMPLYVGAQTPAEFEADYRRRQMIERTALINRKTDDGKPQA